MKHGTEQQNFETGAKRDTQADKLRFDLISPLAMTRIAKVYTDGAKHYGDRNWEKGIPNARCFASLSRHVNAYHLGDTSEDHLAQAAWNAIAMLHNEEAIKRGLMPASINDMPNYRERVQDECNEKAQNAEGPQEFMGLPVVYTESLNQNNGGILLRDPTDEELVELFGQYASYVNNVPQLPPTDHPLDGYYTSEREGGMEGYGLIRVNESKTTWFEPDLSLTEGIPVNSPITNEEYNLIRYGEFVKVPSEDVRAYVEAVLNGVERDPVVPHLSPSESAKLEARVKASLNTIFNNDHIDLREGTTEVVEKFGSQDDLDRVTADLVRLGCPLEVATQIVGGIHFPDTLMVKGWVYVAGPMRGYEKFNFPAFDATRDVMLKKGFVVISPADIDRATNKNADDTTQDVTDQTSFALRDFWSLYFIRKMNPQTGSIALLEKWHRSTGASAEFFTARWLGLNILNDEGEPYIGNPVQDFALAND